MKTIYIRLAQKTPQIVFKKYGITQWYYFSPDFLTFHLLNKNCSSGIHYYDISEILQKKALELKNSYIDLIGQLGIKYSKRYPLAWWTSLVAERNEMSTHAFLIICYYNIFCELFENDGFQDNSLILVESIALFRLIVKHLRTKYRVIILGKPYFFSWPFIRPQIAAGYRLLRIMVWIFIGRFKYVPKLRFTSNLKKILIRTWISDKAISVNGELKDAYFPGLLEYLEKNEYEPIIIPNFYNLTLTKKEIQKRINHCKYQFFIPENYLCWRDYFKIIGVLIYQAIAFNFKYVEFNEKDISSILAETHRTGLFSSYIYIAQAFALKNLSNESPKIDFIIYTFENMVPEKPFSYAIKKYFPEARSIGFQHSVLYPLQTCHYPAVQEWKIMPLPDKIVCSGKFFSDIYIKHGAPKERLILGPALRFKNLISKVETDNENISLKVFPKNKILISFPLAYSDALELAIKSAMAIKSSVNVKELKVGLKPHPMMSVNELSTIKSFFEDADYNVETIDRPMDKVLPEYSLLITMASGVVFDGMIEGVPVIRVGRSSSLNFDPADFIENNPYDFKAQTVEQLGALICKLLLLDDKKRLENYDFGRQFVKESFNPVTKETLSAFI